MGVARFVYHLDLSMVDTPNVPSRVAQAIMHAPPLALFGRRRWASAQLDLLAFTNRQMEDQQVKKVTWSIPGGMSG